MSLAEQILDALGEVGADLVDMSEKQRFPKSFLRRTLPVAACAAVMVTCGVLAQRYLTASPALASAELDQPKYAVSAPVEEKQQTGEWSEYEELVVEPLPDAVMLSRQESVCSEDEAKRNNLTLACEAINGLVLVPGEEFSFNEAVGERTEEAGYLPASPYDDEDSVGEVGGGIGQVASMLYCASLKLDLRQVERAGNTYPVTYVPAGFDAAVYWGVTDYRFCNSLQSSIQIRAEVEDDVVWVELWGPPSEARNITLESEQISNNAVLTYQVFRDEKGKVLREKEIDFTHYQTRP